MEKRLGADPIKTLHGNENFIVRLFDNNCINIASVHGTQYYSVSIQLDDMPKEFEQDRKRGHINVFVAKNLDMWVNGKEIKE